MATKMRRLTVTIPDDVARDVDKIKGKDFLNASQSKTLMYLLRIGLNNYECPKTSKADGEPQAG